jgi:hypothetical protein
MVCFRCIIVNTLQRGKDDDDDDDNNNNDNNSIYESAGLIALSLLKSQYEYLYTQRST